MKRSFLMILAAAALGGALSALILQRTPVRAQAAVPTAHAGLAAAVPAGGDVVVSYDNGLFAIVHPGTAAQPSGYIHTYRIDANGKITGISSTGLDSDTGKLYDFPQR